MTKTFLNMVALVIVLAFSTVSDILAEENTARKHVEAALMELKESQNETSLKEDDLISETNLETEQDSRKHEQNNEEDESSSQDSESDPQKED